MTNEPKEITLRELIHETDIPNLLIFFVVCCWFV